MATQVKAVTPEMTDKQARFVEAYIRTGSVIEAGRIAGYAHDSGSYGAIRSSTIQNALHAYRVRTIKGEGATIGMKCMLRLAGAESEAPAAVQFQAAKWLLEAAGHGASADDDGEAKPLAEMTEQELERVIGKMQEQIEKGGELPVIRVTDPPESSSLKDARAIP